MDTVLQCDCGFEARAQDEDSLVAEVQRHAWEAHDMELSHDEALLLAFRAELGANTPRGPSSPPDRRRHDLDMAERTE
jgi:uncharacterized protein DUF1059